MHQQHDLDEEPQTSSTEDMSENSGSSTKGNPDVASADMPPHLSSCLTLTDSSNMKAVSAGAVYGNATLRPIEQQANGVSNISEDDKKREHKKRSKNWTRAETLKLIKARTELDEKFRKTGRKIGLWDEIALTLHQANFLRDGQQCKDKWEKLTAGYKEVRDGARDKEDHPFYEELHLLLSWKSYKRENDVSGDGAAAKRPKVECGGNDQPVPSWHQPRVSPAINHGDCVVDQTQLEEPVSSKSNREESISFMDLSIVQELLETIVNRQQMLFRVILDALEKRDQVREQMRYEREEKWRAEERAQRIAFHNAMVVLIQQLMGDNKQSGVDKAIVLASTETVPTNGVLSPKKRSKNWKKSEVFALIRLRRDMESKFVQSTRRAGLWEELGDKLSSVGIQRDGKQCREKWDKLMAEYKDVLDGRKDKEESPYFAELTTFVVRSKDTEEAAAAAAAKPALGSPKGEEATCPS